MSIFERLSVDGYEQVVFCHCKETGLKAIIAIHDTTLGPALGGCRMWPYESDEEALEDVLRLAKGMTYKSALAGLNLGGGKAVIIGDPKKDKTEGLFRALGRYIDGLGGRYITAEDVGTTVMDMETILMETNYVSGLPQAIGGLGDPSKSTAHGTYMGIKACLQHLKNNSSVGGVKVAVQGLGNVGMRLVRELSQHGAEIYACDIDEKKSQHAREHYGVHIVSNDDIYDLDIDVFSPCALGGSISEETIPRLKCKIVAGSANNQLADEDQDGERLKAAGILYAPDYVISCGGLISVTNNIEGFSEERAVQRTEVVYKTLLKILDRADKDNITTKAASDIVATERLAQVGALKSIYKPRAKDFQFFEGRYHYFGG